MTEFFSAKKCKKSFYTREKNRHVTDGFLRHVKKIRATEFFWTIANISHLLLTELIYSSWRKI